MRIYVVKRILSLFPALLFVILFSFILLHYAPGDPADRILNSEGFYDNGMNAGIPNEDIKLQLRHDLGLDLPLFYFSLCSLSELKSADNTSHASIERFVPFLVFHKKNQFNNWMFGDGHYSKGVIFGDLGTSWVSHQKVSSIIYSHIGWSLFFTIFSVVIAYLISVPAGLASASRPGSKTDRSLNIIIRIIFSLPSFWIASLLMLSFCNPGVLNILPSSGIGPVGGFDPASNFAYRFFHSIPYLILPTICYTYSSFAFLTRNIKVTVSDILREDFIKTARAKGLDEKTVLRRHAFRNALLPMITIFSHVFPIAIGKGSVIIETIFTIPGMGLAIYQAITAQDYPVIVSVFMITGLITMISFLLSDILYAIADPRISYTSQL